MTEEFLDHNELGLAFETLVNALLETGSIPSPEAHTHLAAAADEMGLQDDADWRHLNAADRLEPGLRMPNEMR